MKRLKYTSTLFFFLAVTLISNAQKQEAEKLADNFWQYIKADSSAFAISKQIGHDEIDALKLSETILAAALNCGKPVVIDRKGNLISQSSNGLMGKGQYICFNYRNKYLDELLGESLVFEKLLFFRRTKTDKLKLVQYNWSKKATDISCD
jgi:hypothetical protein